LLDVFAEFKYGRKEEIKSKFLDKGNAREEDSITLYSRVTKTLFNKNAERLVNSFITGEPDLFIGQEIYKATEIIDIKSSFSLNTFLSSKHSPLDKGYVWQGHGYMMLTGAQKHTVAFCLINSPVNIIDDEKRRLAWKMGLIDTELSEEYNEKCKQIELNHIFDFDAFVKECPHYAFHNTPEVLRSSSIPMKDRVHTKVVQRDDAAIKNIELKVELARKWMNENLFNV